MAMTKKEILKRLTELKGLARQQKLDINEEIKLLEAKLMNGNSSQDAAWKKVELARHTDRPTTLDYIDMIFDDFLELHGDRGFSDDPAMIGGIAFLNGKPLTIIGQQRGRNLKENLFRIQESPAPGETGGKVRPAGCLVCGHTGCIPGCGRRGKGHR
jgi:acetyl-CoA carboxylase carboxyl transferase subunit alpha